VTKSSISVIKVGVIKNSHFQRRFCALETLTAPVVIRRFSGACRINAQLAAVSILLVLFLALFRYIATAMRLKSAENLTQNMNSSLQSD